MDIFTVVKANIKAHRGQFVGVILMMTIAIASILSFTNVIFSIDDSIREANRITNTPDQNLIVERSVFTDEIYSTLINNDKISSVEKVEVLGLHAIKVPGDTDDIHTYNSQVFVMPDAGRYPLVNDEFTALSDEKLNVKPGEVYFDSGIATQMGVVPGDEVILKCESTTRTFIFAGYIEDPWGSVTIGWKHVVMNETDYNDFYNEVCETYAEFDIAREYDYYLVEINMTDPNLNVNEMNKIINENTGIYDLAQGSLSKNESTDYMGMMVIIVSSVLIGVACILYIVLMVVIANNISSTIKTDYKTLGVFKSQGFSSKKLRAIYLWQYMIAELIGAVLGIILSFVLLKVLLSKFATTVGVILTPSFNELLVSGVIIAILGISVIIISICTNKISRVSPHKAISEGRDDVSFSSRIMMPISKKLLSASVALRNITSAISQYVGIMITALIMVVLLVFVLIGGQCLSSKNTLSSLAVLPELGVAHYDNLTDEEKVELDELVSSYATIQEEYTVTSFYITCESTKLQCTIFEDPSVDPCIAQGRAPLYDNEVVIGTGVAERFGKEIGDTIVLTYNDYSYEYLISGICNTMIDVGMVVDMGYEAACHVGLEDRAMYFQHGFLLENPDNKNEWYPRAEADKIADAINERFDNVNAFSVDTNYMGSVMGDTIAFAGYVVYVLTALFVVIIVTMACTKCFNNERRMLGIYKAMGFTSGNLRTQFAFRFMIVFAVGSVLGLLVSALTVKSFFVFVFSTMGVANMRIDFVPVNYIMPLVVICISAFVFSYLASSRVKRIDINELIVE